MFAVQDLNKIPLENSRLCKGYICKPDVFNLKFSMPDNSLTLSVGLENVYF